MTLNDVIFIDNYPKLDLHGFDRESARVATNDFINDNVKLKNDIVVIIHGIGSGIIKNCIHDTLRINKYVLGYKLFPYNIGCTIVNLKIDKLNIKWYHTNRLLFETKIKKISKNAWQKKNLVIIYDTNWRGN